MSPFDLNDATAYRAWRARKLGGYPRYVDDLIVPIDDPRTLAAPEFEALWARLAKANCVVYQSTIGSDPDRDVPIALGRRFGLRRLDRNPGSDEDAVTAITLTDRDGRGEFIPYTDRPLHWHTDGYYNSPDRRIRAWVLHCVAPAAHGGENALLDPEIVYILLRDEDPALMTALMAPDAMTIPARRVDGVVRRPAQSGPVFQVLPDGSLHMRYTRRTRNVRWKPDPALEAALSFLDELFASDSPYAFRLTLQAGWGVLSRNVLHDRAGFRDDGEHPRLLYRARYYDGIAR